MDVEQRLVTAWYSQVTKADGTPVIDSQGDIIPIQELEQADIEAFAQGGLQRGGEMHETVGGSDIVQHFTLDREQRLALGFGEGPQGGIAKFYISDDALWNKIKAGEYPEISIAGDAVREKV